MISLRNVRKQYGDKEILKGIDLDVLPGTCTVLLGPSGSGKSTLIRCINGLVRPESGAIALSGAPVALHDEGSWQRLRTQVGMVFQDYSLFSHLNVMDNMTLVPVRRGLMNKPTAQQEALLLLHKVGLAHKAQAYPGELSGGQQQRVAIVRALLMRPRAMLFDEPTSALDPEAIGGVLRIMRELAADGMTMIVVTHEMRFAREVSDQIVFMEDGQIVEQGPPEEIFERPRQARTRAFFSNIH
ncbi:amino acid ABC transporter ATP-binding protein [Herbaspirillum lusitanum]|uniref:Amino acid ABC transporter ATP-binding protein n=1 Tax=Herbaspirillum lusitanum TaxID=213312 RepID=A0ABW9AGK0_9BURK